MKKIESGENLFKVISNLSPKRFSHFKLDYAIFEQRKEVEIDGERFHKSDFKEVGKLMIPHYNLHSRESLVKRDKSDNISERGRFTKFLDEHSEVKHFYIRGIDYYPLDSNILVLKDSQIK